MANENMKNAADYQQPVKTPKVATVTWFAVHESLMNPGLPHITSYMQGNINMQGNRKFFWMVGSDYITTTVESGETVIVAGWGGQVFAAELRRAERGGGKRGG